MLPISERWAVQSTSRKFIVIFKQNFVSYSSTFKANTTTNTL